MQYQEIEKYFENHPLKEKFSSFPDDERRSCVSVAERDILAAIHPVVTQHSEADIFLAAVAEQTLFLLLNPENLTGINSGVSAVSSAGESRKFGQAGAPLLGQRAAGLAGMLSGAPEMKLVRG